jgi:hypothetical protein
MSVHFPACVLPFFRMKQLCFRWTDFHQIWYLSIFRKSVEKIQGSIISDKHKGYFTRRQIHLFDHISLNSSYNEKYLRQNVDRIKTHILRSLTFFFGKSAVYEIMCKNMAEPDRPQMTMWRMRVACWIPKITDTNSEYVIHFHFPLQQWFGRRPSYYVISTLSVLL